MVYFTGKGDKGKSIIGDKKISKDNFIIETLGELDELNSLIGLAKSHLTKIETNLCSACFANQRKHKHSHSLNEKLTNIQNNLFIIQANIAYLLYKKFKPPMLSKDSLAMLEKEIMSIEDKISPKNKFIIYGSEKNSAWLDYLRAVSRRIERRLIVLSKKYHLDETIIAYLNRLSSYFYAWARYLAYIKKISEQEPWYNKDK
ncbi:MAG: ATP--cob(I)alamin adenosyltransferase [Candidatus Parcubacteria bacterium]|nr:MAG: ATP--cob(I)alamin adenosyltransferase [Candidatus Parcubacteria bacterium]